MVKLVRQGSIRGPDLPILPQSILHSLIPRKDDAVTKAKKSIGSTRRTTARARRRRRGVARRRLAARHAQEVLRDAAAAQQLLARDEACSSSRARSTRAWVAPRRGRMPSTHVITVPSGVFSSCEKPEASTPSEASRWDSASRASAARRSEMSRQTSTTCDAFPAASVWARVHLFPGDRALGAPALADAHLSLARSRGRRASGSRRRRTGRGARPQEQPSSSRRMRPVRARNASLAAITCGCRRARRSRRRCC